MSLSQAQILKLFPGASIGLLQANAVSSPSKPIKTPARPISAPKNPYPAAEEQFIPTPSNQVEFTIPVEPRSVQFGKRMGFNKSTGKMLMFCDKKTKTFYEAITEASLPYCPSSPLQGPLKVTLGMFFSRPKNRMGSKFPDGPFWKTTKPDTDNLTKGICDPLTKAGFWEDDAQIVHQEAMKFYAAKDGSGCIKVTITPLVES